MTLLNAWFDAFLRSRRAASLFRRRVLPDAGMGRGAAGAVPTDFSDALRGWHRCRWRPRWRR